MLDRSTPRGAPPILKDHITAGKVGAVLCRQIRSETCIRSYMKPVATPRHPYGADASRSSAHTRGEECAMPAWLHSERRLLHAYVPACSGPASASLSGKRDVKTRDEGTETASLIQFLLCRDGALARDPRQLRAN